MEAYERARIESLLERDEELQSLWTEHQRFERELERLDDRSHLTPREERQRKELQKRKLAGKDRIAEIVARYEEA